MPKLPTSLEELRGRQYVRRISDPETGAGYEYRPKSETTYELCAVFAFDEAVDRSPYQYGSDSWNHGKGRTCFALDVSRSAPY